MKKIILILLVNLSCVIMASADIWTPCIVDTLSKRVINGLEVVPIRTTYESGEIFWRLQVPDFEKKFWNFESKYPGIINYGFVSEAITDSIADWEDEIWHKVVPARLKSLIKDLSDRRVFSILLYINQKGNVFTVEFEMTDNVFQILTSLPENMMKSLYANLLEETCETIKRVDFQYFDDPFRLGKEYITKNIDWYIYDTFGTHNPTKLQKMMEDGTLEKIFEGKEGGRKK
ncbi:hypothetical protein [Butyricimonas paravirosa]|uniref:hypothetical protein n=1 Tax=Butyricimonas paravirosa TaxID=1472417 RepID=UPI00210C3815|nr:hypothetical protein [Butyricimonas paravirosa]MCQ4875302.1 hypothetical protein [Butyricimonas paravirosa]